MTSEICVMNRMSVVLAADSASTISYYENGAQVQRYFKGANKVFQLSDSHPVGLMIYGNAEVLGVPWELVIKAFRKQLKVSSFETISGYGQAFGQFINENQTLFPSELREESFRDSVELDTVISCRDFNQMLTENPDFDEASHLIELSNFIANKPFVNELDSEFEQQLLDVWPDLILQRLRENMDTPFGKLLADRTDERLLEIISLSISNKAKSLPTGSTGLVFAGFGEQSVYPEIYFANEAGFVANRLVMGKADSVAISQKNNSYISGFAQASMADTFIIGFDSQVYETINQVQKDSFLDVLAPFLEPLGASVDKTEGGAVVKDSNDNIVVSEQEFRQRMQATLSDVGRKIMKESRLKHGEPLERVISMLPVEEMAELAATMVDLQSLKEKVTRPSETVGGPVDVAIITKNEGLVWKKRKHFFDASINQRYLHRLQSQD